MEERGRRRRRYRTRRKKPEGERENGGLRRREYMDTEGRFLLLLALLPLSLSSLLHAFSPPPLYSSSVLAIEGISHQNLHPPGGVNREAEAKESNYVLCLL